MVFHLRSQIRLGKIVLPDFNWSVILLTSDYRVPTSRTVTYDTLLLFKATYLVIYF